MTGRTPLEDVSVRLVESVEDAQLFLAWIDQPRTHISVDTETTGLQWWTPNFVRLVQFGDVHGGWALPLRDWRAVTAQALSRLREQGVPVVFHNAPFDVKALRSEGLQAPDRHQIQDTQILHTLAHPMQRHGLKPICRGLYGPRAVAGQDWLKFEMSKHHWTWATIPTSHPAYWGYGVLDTILTARLYEDLLPHRTPAYEREMAVQAVMTAAEVRGLRVDNNYTSALRDEWRQEASDLRSLLQEAGIENPSSNQQVTDVLSSAGWDPEEWTETGKARLDKGILQALSGRFPGVAEPLLRYRRITKWSSTYLDPFLLDQDADGYVHPSIRTMGAARTGRMSVQGPALQTLPHTHHIRDCIVPDEGHSLWSMDYDGMELRVFAHYAQEPTMLQTFRDGEDLHTTAAALSYGVRPEDVTKEQRTIAKNCVVPETPVLTSDLRWVPAGSLEVGDGLYGFDADQQEGSHSREKMRRWRANEVTMTGRAIRPVITIHMEDGSSITGTYDHPVLTTNYRQRAKSRWATLDNVRVGDYALRATEVWEEATSKESGWLAGVLDGEGCVEQRRSRLSVSQNPGAVLDELVRLLPGWSYNDSKGKCVMLSMCGTLSERLRFLGEVRPIRLIESMYRACQGQGFHTRKVKIVRIVRHEDPREIVTLGTSTETYIANGYANHNTSFSRLYGAGPAKIAQTAGVSEQEILSFITGFDSRFPRGTQFIQEVQASGAHRLRSEGEAYVTTFGGRRLPVDEDHLYALVNRLIQGSCADVLKDAILRLDAAGLGNNILLPVHDELLFSFPSTPDGEEQAKEARSLMQDDRFSAPLTCDLSGPLSSWGESYR